MPTIEVYAHGRVVTFLPSERAERIILAQPRWWEHRIDYARDLAVSSDAYPMNAAQVLGRCRQIGSERPAIRDFWGGAA